MEPASFATWGSTIRFSTIRNLLFQKSLWLRDGHAASSTKSFLASCLVRRNGSQRPAASGQTGALSGAAGTRPALARCCRALSDAGFGSWTPHRTMVGCTAPEVRARIAP